MEVFGLGMGLMVAWQAIIWTILGLAAPLLWVWMLIDSLLREEWEYPNASATSNNKLVWVLLMVFVHITAVLYFFLVFAKVKRGTIPRPVQAAPISPAVAQTA